MSESVDRIGALRSQMKGHSPIIIPLEETKETINGSEEAENDG